VSGGRRAEQRFLGVPVKWDDGGHPPGPERHDPGVTFRPIEEPTPLVGYGIVWSQDHPSRALESFLDVAKGFADATVPTAVS
jgi:hypothetical protein